MPSSCHFHVNLSDVIHAHHQHTPNSVTSTIHQNVNHPVYQPCQSVPTATALSSFPCMPASCHFHVNLSDVIHAHHQHTPNSVTYPNNQHLNSTLHLTSYSVSSFTTLSS